MRFQDLDLSNIHPKQMVPHPCYQCPEKTDDCKETCKYPALYDDVKKKQYADRQKLFVQQAGDKAEHDRLTRLARRSRR